MLPGLLTIRKEENFGCLKCILKDVTAVLLDLQSNLQSNGVK